jgi:mannose-6-phosphate isomerase-like protein (cupin superfamily)
MASYTVKRVEEMEGIYGGAFRRARAELGVESFGVAIEDFPPNFDRYPEHDHSGDGQEEVYAVLRGSGAIEIEGERVEIDPETLVRVGPGTRRKVLSGPDGLRLLALGGIPGRPYVAPDFSKLGGPEAPEG